jgi:lysyl endopeptidase
MPRPALRLAFPWALLALLAAPAAAQLAQPGRPATLRHPHLLAAELPAYVLPRPDVAGLMKEDEQRNQWPARYGAVIPSTLSCADAGRWDSLPSGELVWRLRLTSPGAKSLGLLFERFELPPSGQLFVYEHAHGTLLGAFTAATRQANGMLAVQPVPGDELVLEYVQAASDAGRPELRLGEVVHDYRGILDQLEAENPIALGGGCLVDVNCPAGAPYQDIKRATIMVLIGGFNCSAAMLNNTAHDATPYFLTANHCGNMANVVAVFGYWNSGCSTLDAAQSNTISGATLLSASTRFDSQLYQLSATPPQAFEPFFAGWDRGTGQPGPAIGLSHPSGHPQKITVDEQAPFLSGTDYRATWEIGKLEGGSSGSPLFNGEKRVIGPACCVSDFTCRNQWAIYGRFGGFWEQQNLGTWLDPLGTDPEGIDGNDPFQGLALVYNGGGTNPLAYSSSPPNVGGAWSATIDTSSVPLPGVHTWIVGYLGRTQGFFVSQGELLVDVGTPLVFTLNAPSVGGVATYSGLIPNNPGLIGQVVYTQGLLVYGQPLVLTNAVEMRLR